jgi:hypothetical protein
MTKMHGVNNVKCTSVYFIHRNGYFMSGSDFRQITVKFVAVIKENVTSARLLRSVNLNYTLRNKLCKITFRKKSTKICAIKDSNKLFTKFISHLRNIPCPL